MDKHILNKGCESPNVKKKHTLTNLRSYPSGTAHGRISIAASDVRAASAPQTAHATEPRRTALWEKKRSEALQ